MRSSGLVFALAFFVLALGGCPDAPRAPEPEPPIDVPLVVGSGVSRPALDSFTLDNGLRVFLLPDASAPLACVQLWVMAGSVDETEGRGPGTGTTGLSHFFEHLMFQGTERFPDYDRALLPLGAKNNAFTYQDATVYWAYTPKEHLRHILDIEADRFRFMLVDFVHLEPEREVVKSERRQNTDADPGELADELATRRTFDRFPYRWGPIGWMEDLDSVPLETAQRYHAEHYVTNGAYMIIAGDFAIADAKRFVEETWGPLQRPASAPDFLRKSETLPLNEDWIGPRSDHLLSPVEQPIVYWSYRAPAPGGATMRDYAALELVDHALTAGKAGRLSRRLVYSETPKVSNLWARLTPLRHPYNYLWRADLLDGVTTDEVEDEIDAALEVISRRGLEADELAQAVASLTADAIRTNLSNSDKAETIGMSIASTGDPFALYERLDAYPTITQDEIKRAVEEYLVPERRVRVVVVSPERIGRLTEALAAADPSAAPLAPLLKDALRLFVQALDLKAQRKEAEREARAIAMLEQRADVALKAAATKEEKAAINAYMTENEMGGNARGARRAEQDKALREAEATLAKEQAELSRRLVKTTRDTPSTIGDHPTAKAIDMLLTTLDRFAEVPATFVGQEWPASNRQDLAQRVALREGLAGAEQLGLQTIASFVLEARGLSASAQAARNWVEWAAPQLLAKPLDPAAKTLVELASSLTADTSRRGLKLADTPMPAVRPTIEGIK